MEVDQVWVAVNKPLSKETRDSISAGVVLPRAKLVFLDLEDCWRLVQPYILTSKRDVLQLSQDILREFNSPYDLRLTTTDRGQTLTIHERYPGQSQELPLTGRVVFTFDDPSRAAHLTEYWNRVQETGEQEELPEGITARIETDGIDEVALQLFGGLPRQMSFSMGSATSNEKTRLAFRFESLDGSMVELPFVEMEILAKGTRQIRMENLHQDLPIQVKMIAMLGEFININFTVRIGEISAHWVYRGMSILDSIKQRGELTVTNVDTGIVASNWCIAIAEPQQEETQSFLDLARVLAAIEGRTGRVVIIPDRGLNHEEAEIMDELRQIVDNGYVEGTADTFEIAVLVNDAVLEDVLKETISAAQQGAIRYAQEEKRDIFGTRFSLGSSVLAIPPSTLVNESEIRSAVQESTGGEEVQVVFKFKVEKGKRFRKDFTHWQDGRILDQSNA